MGEILFFPGNDCKCLPESSEVQILSDRHKEILRTRVNRLIKSVTSKDLNTIHEETGKKIETVKGSRDFIVKTIERVTLLYEFLFDNQFPKSKLTEKTIAAGLLYFISPKDFLPDDIPGLGMLDDAYVIRQVWEKSCSEIKKYIALRGLNEEVYL